LQTQTITETGDDRPLWITGSPTPDSQRSLRQAGYPQLHHAKGHKPTLLNFVATDLPGVSGFVQFDDADFDGTASQFLSNSNITDLPITAFGEVHSRRRGHDG
jgi:hypothetical protein